ncbi:hypothetical protein GCM10023156_29410 [Novipirellula rosea]|uniref:Uncharacterized protein n=1 Tax=Novipirellula rosea TaxID=1031540 RepID=A0ABP8MUY6_9BACT
MTVGEGKSVRREIGQNEMSEGGKAYRGEVFSCSYLCQKVVIRNCTATSHALAKRSYNIQLP